MGNLKQEARYSPTARDNYNKNTPHKQEGNGINRYPIVSLLSGCSKASRLRRAVCFHNQWLLVVVFRQQLKEPKLLRSEMLGLLRLCTAIIVVMLKGGRVGYSQIDKARSTASGKTGNDRSLGGVIKERSSSGYGL